MRRSLCLEFLDVRLEVLTEHVLTGRLLAGLSECLLDAGLDGDHLPGLRHRGGGAQAGVEPVPGAVAGH